ncbi:hypothetical protein YC2023_064238 [Brassica napus]
MNMTNTALVQKIGDGLRNGWIAKCAFSVTNRKKIVKMVCTNRTIAIFFISTPIDISKTIFEFTADGSKLLMCLAGSKLSKCSACNPLD